LYLNGYEYTTGPNSKIVLFSAFGAFLLIFYFRKKDMDFIREGFYVGPSRINMITLGVS